jgi:hypothetical protein
VYQSRVESRELKSPTNLAADEPIIRLPLLWDLPSST